MKRIGWVAAITVTAAMFSGCAGNKPSVTVKPKEQNVLYIESTLEKYKPKYEASNQLQNFCSMQIFLYTAAKETLKRGFRYFALADPGYGYKYDNNMMGLPIVTPEAYQRYCNPELQEPDTGLEDDKCEQHFVGYDIVPYHNGYIKMFKKPNYLFPTWDAKKVLQEVEPKVNECIDWSKYKEASSAKDLHFNER